MLSTFNTKLHLSECMLSHVLGGYRHALVRSHARECMSCIVNIYCGLRSVNIFAMR